jgi:hypothetical protein
VLQCQALDLVPIVFRDIRHDVNEVLHLRGRIVQQPQWKVQDLGEANRVLFRDRDGQLLDSPFNPRAISAARSNVTLGSTEIPRLSARVSAGAAAPIGRAIAVQCVYESTKGNRR